MEFGCGYCFRISLGSLQAPQRIISRACALMLIYIYMLYRINTLLGIDVCLLLAMNRAGSGGRLLHMGLSMIKNVHY
jgi:hypothetical protein